MRVLLDTPIFLWWLSDDPKLSEPARSLITSASDAYVSSASIWEATIKVGLGKLDVDLDALVSEIEHSGFRELPVTARHAVGVRTLPDLHRDPFVRILIAQAVSEPLRFLTADSALAGYSELVHVV
jgi:PIN domain nuclease of toxin-antitoxin system